MSFPGLYKFATSKTLLFYPSLLSRAQLNIDEVYFPRIRLSGYK